MEKEDYVIVGFDPSWHQMRAHGAGTFSSLQFIKLTPEEAKEREAKMPPKYYLYSRKDRPDWWEKYGESPNPI